jgi:hypothetical protein
VVHLQHWQKGYDTWAWHQHLWVRGVESQWNYCLQKGEKVDEALISTEAECSALSSSTSVSGWHFILKSRNYSNIIFPEIILLSCHIIACIHTENYLFSINIPLRKVIFIIKVSFLKYNIQC